MPPTTLQNRIAVVTGAASGIGAATARLLAAQRAGVALLARRRDRLDALAGEIGERALAVPVDVTRPETLRAAAETIAARLGRVDLVVNNAGVMLPAPIDQLRADDWQRMLDTNVSGVLETVRAFVPALLEAAADGPADLVNISSIGARTVFPGFAVYGATKAAVTHLSEGLRAELAPRGVRVTNVEPGFTATELQGHATDPDAQDLMADMRTAFTVLQPEEIAELIAFAVGRPRHVNLPQVTVMPTGQA